MPSQQSAAEMDKTYSSTAGFLSERKVGRGRGEENEVGCLTGVRKKINS